MIYIFKTDVKTSSKVKKLEKKINEQFPSAKWNFDIEDCDNIFRIDIDYINAKKISAILKKIDVKAIELE